MIHLIASMLLLQQPTAEETLKQIEESIWKAKTVSVKYRLDLVMGEQKATRTGIVLLKEGNRLKITVGAEGGGKKGGAWVLSDGTGVMMNQREGDVEHDKEFVASRTLRNKATTSLVRAGCLDLCTLPDRIEHGNTPKEDLILKDLKFGGKDGELQTLTYTLHEGSGKMEMKLWYDPKGLTLKKRTFSVPELKASGIETYEEFTLNGDIPDSTFQLPKKK